MSIGIFVLVVFGGMCLFTLRRAHVSARTSGASYHSLGLTENLDSGWSIANGSDVDTEDYDTDTHDSGTFADDKEETAL